MYIKCLNFGPTCGLVVTGWDSFSEEQCLNPTMLWCVVASLDIPACFSKATLTYIYIFVCVMNLNYGCIIKKTLYNLHYCSLRYNHLFFFFCVLNTEKTEPTECDPIHPGSGQGRKHSASISQTWHSLLHPHW